jgi:hypothetical protein
MIARRRHGKMHDHGRVAAFSAPADRRRARRSEPPTMIVDEATLGRAIA